MAVVLHTALTLPQLKILQEVITLSVFVPFAIFYMHELNSERIPHSLSGVSERMK